METTRLYLVATAVWLSSTACAGSTATARIEPASPDGSGIREGRLHVDWAQRALRQATVEFRQAFAQEGAEALLRLRLRNAELEQLLDPNAAARVERIPAGLSPSPGERRWSMFRTLGVTQLVGFCARGARLVEPNGPEGFRSRAFVVDRLLIIGSERDGLWGAWVEGLVLTTDGRRLLPTTPYDRQVETPRRDHTDVQLWDCDLSVRPQPDQTL